MGLDMWRILDFFKMYNTNKEISYIIADLLSVVTITVCLVLKIPQILNVYSNKSAQGLSIYGLCLELSSYTTMALYNYCNDYVLLSYLEYPFIIIQEIILIILVVHYNKLFNLFLFATFGLYASMTAAFVLDIVPSSVLDYLVPLCTPISASSKIVQFMEIIRTKNSASVSVLTWFLSAFTNITRIYTVYMDSADATLLSNFLISSVLSLAVMLATIFYKVPKARAEL